jgi:hypothetical protein
MRGATPSLTRMYFKDNFKGLNLYYTLWTFLDQIRLKEVKF